MDFCLHGTRPIRTLLTKLTGTASGKLAHARHYCRPVNRLYDVAQSNSWRVFLHAVNRPTVFVQHFLIGGLFKASQWANIFLKKILSVSPRSFQWSERNLGK